MISMITRIFMSKTTCNKNVVIVRLGGCVTIIAEGGMKGHIYMIEFCMEKKGDNHGI